MDRCMDGRHALHLVGLLSDGGVHSSQQHLHALLEMAARRRVPRVYVHVITDGRDTSPTGGVRYLADLLQVTERLSTGRVATICGRYFAMDRDQRWERTQLAWDAIVNGAAARATQTPVAALQAEYEAGITDEFVTPIVVVDADGQPVGPVRDEDSVHAFTTPR
jgi:2,3-bisphosphoglycerate-independent phosphoglycerate mutase